MGWVPKTFIEVITLRNIIKTIMMVKWVLMPLTLFFIRYWQEAQTLCRVVSQRLADAQSQSESLEIKYNKAKRLVREYQSRYLSNLSDPVISPTMWNTTPKLLGVSSVSKRM